VTETKLAVPVGDAMHLALTAGGQSYIDDEIADYHGEAAAFLLSDAYIEYATLATVSCASSATTWSLSLLSRS
jgi:hypothetical protein